MKKSKKKKEMLVLLLLLVAVLILGLLLWKSKHKETKTKAEEETKTIPVASIVAEDISTFSVKNASADMQFVKEEETWKLETEKDRPINQTYVNNMIAAIDDIKALRMMEETSGSLAEYGLEEPSICIQAKTADGQELSFRIGDEAPNSLGYYAMVNEDPTVYLVSSSYQAGLLYSMDDMTEITKAPTITADYVYHVLVEQKDKENFEVLYDPQNTADLSGMSYYPWILPQPYPMTMTADGRKVSTAVANFTDFTYLNCLEYQCVDLAAYGLDDPQASILVEYYNYYTMKLEEPDIDPDTGEELYTRTYKEDAKYKIYVGSQNKDGNYYVMPDGTTEVYTMKAATIDAMLGVTSFSCLNDFIQLVNIDAVEKIVLDIAGEEHTMEIKRTSQIDAEGNETKNCTYLHNGDYVDESVFKDVYQVIVSAKYDAEIKEKTTVSNPDVSITFYLNTVEHPVTIRYYKYNESFYIVDNGMIEFYADARRIDNIVKYVTEFVGDK